jgi:hypothetical protein
MGLLDNALRSASKTVLRKFGKSMTLRRVSTTYDPATGTNTQTTTDYTVYGRVEEYADAQVDGTLIRTGDRRVLIAAAEVSITPLTSDQLLIASVPHAIVNVKATDATEEVATWTLQVRK